MTEHTQLPDGIGVERLPDDVEVLRTPAGFGQNNLHLFAGCEHVDDDRTHRVALATVDRGDVCTRCSGEADGPGGVSPEKYRGRLEYLEPRYVDGLSPMPEERQTPELDKHLGDADDQGTEVIAGD